MDFHVVVFGYCRKDIESNATRIMLPYCTSCVAMFLLNLNPIRICVMQWNDKMEFFGNWFCRCFCSNQMDQKQIRGDLFPVIINVCNAIRVPCTILNNIVLSDKFNSKNNRADINWFRICLSVSKAVRVPDCPVHKCSLCVVFVQAIGFAPTFLK